MQLNLPLHPTMKHPLTGQPLRAVYVDSKGRARYPMIGASQDPNPAPDPDPAPPADPPKDPAPTPDPPKDPAPADPKDLGFPKDTPVAEMTTAEQAAYWKHQSRKHEQTWKGIVGDRKIDEVKNDLTEIQRIRQEQLTPSERAIQEAEQRGRDAARVESNKTLATTLLKTQLKAAGKSDEDIADLVGAIAVDQFIKDNELDTDRLSEFVSKIAPNTDTGGGKDDRRQRDYGGGRRGTSTSTGVAAGRGRYQERHGKKTAES